MRDGSRMQRTGALVGLLTVLAVSGAAAEEESAIDRVLDAIVANEQVLLGALLDYHPLIETYVQTLEPDETLGTVPRRDHYFLGRLDLTSATTASASDRNSNSDEQLLELFKGFYGNAIQPDGFAKMLVLDASSFSREHYDFEFVRHEFLGEIRTLVFEVIPKMEGRPGRFIGRIWVEDRDFHIVRYNGVYTSNSPGNLHFDSWRLNMAPDRWYPAYVYTEESVFKSKGRLKYKHKGQTRIWGYEVQRRGSEDEFTKVLVAPASADDQSESPGHISPIESLRAWEREAEDNVLRRLEKGGLLSPEGEVDGVLQTVVTNLEVTNSLDIRPPVRCRVLMTTPLESFTVGHTIVLSRGLIDVLPDESSLAMVLAHELGHILLGHQLDTSYAFSDQMLVGDKQTMEQFYFQRQTKEELEADEKALTLLANSPYSDLQNAGLFLKALSERADLLPALIRSHFGNRMADGDRFVRMAPVIRAAPELYPTALNQTAALPLGGRVKVDPWTASIELMKDNKIVLLSAREKLPFEITPLMPYLARRDDARGAPAEPEIESADLPEDPDDPTYEIAPIAQRREWVP